MMNNRSIKILLINDNLNDAELMIRTLKKNNLINYVTHLKDDVEGFPFIFCTDPFLHRDVTGVTNPLDMKTFQIQLHK